MAKIQEIMEAIVDISGGTAICSAVADGEDNIDWLEGTTPIAPEVIRAKIVERAYRFKREPLYPDLKEQLDMQFHDQVNGTTTFKDAIQAIKDAHPKP